MKGNVQLEERVGDLQHENVWMSMVVHDQDSLYCATHSKVFIIIFQTLQTRGNRGIFFRLSLLRAAEKTFTFARRLSK